MAGTLLRLRIALKNHELCIEDICSLPALTSSCPLCELLWWQADSVCSRCGRGALTLRNNLRLWKLMHCALDAPTILFLADSRPVRPNELHCGDMPPFSHRTFCLTNSSAVSISYVIIREYMYRAKSFEVGYLFIDDNRYTGMVPVPKLRFVFLPSFSGQSSKSAGSTGICVWRKIKRVVPK
jgi:hypothetical protein